MGAYTHVTRHMYKDMFCVFLDCSLLSRFAKRVLHQTQKPISRAFEVMYYVCICAIFYLTYLLAFDVEQKLWTLACLHNLVNLHHMHVTCEAISPCFTSGQSDTDESLSQQVTFVQTN